MKTITSKLPTLTAFRAMTLRQRATVFVNWLKRQDLKQTYDSCDSGYCVFARFGEAITQEPCEGGNYGFSPSTANSLQVLPTIRLGLSPIHDNDSDRDDIISYAATLKRTRAYLKRKDCRWKPREESVW